MLVDALTD